jgi:hypothetical protein
MNELVFLVLGVIVGNYDRVLGETKALSFLI